MRLLNGWSFERAVNTPVQTRHPSRKATMQRHKRYAAKQARVAELKRMVTTKHYQLGEITRVEIGRFIWEREAWNAAARRDRKTRKRAPNAAEDTSPDHIRELRAQFCDEFIKTGQINVSLQTQLKEYADACRAAPKHSQRVSTEHETHRYSRATAAPANDGSRDAHQISGSAARSIADFLRSE
jgi:hypothetical protein